MARKASLDVIVPESLSKPEDEITATAEKTKGHSSSAIVLTVFALVFGFISITSFLQKSPTVDEPLHLFAGYSYLKWGDFRTNPEHPPLAKLWAALPLLAFDLKDPRQSSKRWDLIPLDTPGALHSVAVSGEMLFTLNDAATLFFYAKLQLIVLAIILGIFVYRWSKELFGFEAAVASLFMYCLDPNILAHSQFVHTDIPFTAIFFIATYFFWRVLGNFSPLNLALVSLSFGLAAITKYAYLAIVLIWTVLGLVKIFSSQSQQCSFGGSRKISSRWGKAALLAGVLICCMLAAYLFIWAAYGFRFDAIPGGARHLPMTKELPENLYLRGLVAFITQHRLFPEAWIYGNLHVFKNLTRAAYLMGLYSEDGFLLYFPVAFTVKTPLPTLLLLITTIGLWICKRKDRSSELFLLIPVVAYFSLGISSRMNIGLRHILPIYPFLFVLLGAAAAELWRGRMWFTRGALVVLSSWYIWSAISTYPHYLAYFNEVAGGPENGHKWLLDSNLDWGQDLKGLKHWMDLNGVKKIQFLYFGFHDISEPKYYGIDAVYLPGSWVNPNYIANKGSEVPEYVAISATLLFGNLLRGTQAYFVIPYRALRPTVSIGYSIAIYRLSDAIEQFRRVIANNSTSAEAHADLASLLGNQGKTAEAVEEYRQAIRLNPNFARARYNLGIILTKRGELEEAVDHLQKAAQITPLDEDIHYDLAVVLALKGDLEGAIEQFRETTMIFHDYTKAYYNLGIILEKKGDIKGAIEQFRETIKVDPTDTKAYYQLGVMLVNTGKLAEATRYFRQAIQLEPEFAEAQESLGRALALQGKRDEALKHFEEAVRIIKSRSTSRTLPSQSTD